MMGKSLVKIAYSKTKYPNVPAVNAISTQVGAYVPQLNVSRGCVSVGTMIKNRSSHIPTTINADATIVPLIVLNRLIASSGAGMMKQQITLAQNSGAYDPEIFELNTAISSGSLPYHAVKYSPNVK